MEYVKRITHRIISHAQQAIAHIETDDRKKALTALRSLIAEIHMLVKAIEVLEQEKAS